MVIPTYGGAEHLGEAVQSVLDQTWQDFELIVVNDALPDDTDERDGPIGGPAYPLSTPRDEPRRGERAQDRGHGFPR
ncbi:MAG: glycosyltransferase [Comamonadaceae bacterium]|nr:glycosyltransferase [Comamonadaceae bacterium]